MTLRRRSARWLSPLALGALLLACPGPARAGWDDFEYGQKLIERGYTDYARRVFESILSDDKRTAPEKDRARFGMALLGKADTIRAMGDIRIPYAGVKEQLTKAVSEIETFLSKSPNDPKADDAKMEIGDLRLTFAQWGAELANGEPVDDPTQDDPDKRIKPYELRKTKPEEVREDMQRAVKSAGETFNALQTGGKTEQTQKLAGFRFVVSQYFQALAHPECSAPHISALESAKRVLEEYSVTNEQYLTGAYAQDYLGQVLQQLGDCAGDGDKKSQLYNDALGWFQAVAGLDDQSEDHRRLIAKGYYHVGRIANAAKDMKAYALAKAARRDYQAMEQRAPRVKKIEDGVLAIVEWALIEEMLGDRNKAIELSKKASDYAKEIGSRRAELRANDVLGKIVSSGASGASGEGDPSVVQKVADDQFAKGRFVEAIAAYRQVIAAAPQTRQGLAQFAVPSWRRIAESYQSLKPPLLFEAAIAYDAIVDEVRSGRVGNKVEADPTAKIAYEAATQQVAILRKLNTMTGDAAVKDRLNARIEEQAKLFDTGGSGGDQLYNLALGRFNQALDEQAKGGASGWQATLAQARQGFADVAKSKSDYQDNALTYLVRVPLTLEKYDEAVAEADKALAWWDTPEAKARIEGNEPQTTRRKQQRAWTSIWKATALRSLNKDADALAMAADFEKRNPGADRAVVERARGMEVEILADLGRVEEAEQKLIALQRDFPEYSRLGVILLKIAAFYRKEVSATGAKLDELRWKLSGKTVDGVTTPGLRQRIVEMNTEEGKLSAAVGDLRTLIGRAEAEKRDAEAKETDPALSDDEHKKATEARVRAEEALARLKPRLAEATQALAKVRTDRVAAVKEAEGIVAQRKAIEKEQAAPLRKVAELYRQLDDIVRDLDSREPPGGRKRRKSDFVYTVATQYYQLARVEAEVSRDWEVVRALFEDYLAFPDVKALPDGDDRKRTVMRALGDSYYRKALAAATPEAQREAYATAVGYLQAGLAKLPQNTPVVIGHLAGDTVVLSWQAKEPLKIDGTWRIPIARATTVAELRENVKNLGPDQLPKYLSSKVNENYQRIVKQFQDHVASEDKISTGELESTVQSFKVGGFDPIFFGEHAFVSPPETLLILARAYARSGIAANARKAFNMTTAVIYASKVDQDGPEWWEAKTIALEVGVTDAEREFAAGGDQSAKAKVSAKNVESGIVAMKKLYPHIGGSERHDATLKEWKDIHQRLRALMAQLRLPTTPVDLDAELKAEEESPPPPATPAPGAPPPADGPAMGDAAMGGEPAMDDAGMNDAGMDK